MCLGLCALCLICLYVNNDVLAAISFCLALNFKQIALYYAPIIFFFYIRKAMDKKVFAIKQILLILLASIIVYYEDRQCCHTDLFHLMVSLLFLFYGPPGTSSFDSSSTSPLIPLGKRHFWRQSCYFLVQISFLLIIFYKISLIVVLWIWWLKSINSFLLINWSTWPRSSRFFLFSLPLLRSLKSIGFPLKIWFFD